MKWSVQSWIMYVKSFWNISIRKKVFQHQKNKEKCSCNLAFKFDWNLSFCKRYVISNMIYMIVDTTLVRILINSTKMSPWYFKFKHYDDISKRILSRSIYEWNYKRVKNVIHIHCQRKPNVLHILKNAFPHVFWV